jgi:flagellar biosynthesis protein FliQ
MKLDTCILKKWAMRVALWLTCAVVGLALVAGLIIAFNAITFEP